MTFPRISEFLVVIVIRHSATSELVKKRRKLESSLISAFFLNVGIIRYIEKTHRDTTKETKKRIFRNENPQLPGFSWVNSTKKE